MIDMATFNTRIQLKYDTLTNFTTNNPVLLSGEMALVNIPADSSTGMNEPALMMKIGDGSKAFNELPWASALAADVIPSLKGNNPTLAASSVTGLTEFVNNLITTSNVQYQVVKNGDMGFKLQSKTGSGEWADVSTIELVPPTYTLESGSTNGTVSFNGEDVAVTGLGSAAYTESSAYDAAGSAAAVQTTVTGTSDDTSSQVTLYGVKKYAQEQATSAQTAANSYADGLIDALDYSGNVIGTGEIISNVTETNGVIEVTKRSLTASDIPTIEQSQVNGLETALSGKQDTLVFNTAYNAETNKAATMTDVTNAVAGLSGAMHYIGESTTDPSTGTATVEGHEDWVAGDVVTYQSKEYVYDGENWRELGDESSFAVKGSIVDADIATNANIAQSKIANLVTDLAAKATPADITSAIQALDKASTAVATGNKITAIEEVDGIINVTTGAIVAGDIPTLPTSKIDGLDTTLSGIDNDITALEGLVGETAVSTQISTAIGNLDVTDSAVTNEFVTSVSQSDGLISVVRAQPTVANISGLQTALDAKANADDLATVATTGKIDDLTQTATIIFNCGSATAVM